MLSVGLTGGIGSGKSAVTRLLVEHGAALVDADLVAREVVAPGTPGLAQVVAEFGPDVLRPDGALDREALGRRVFPDPAALARLNAVVHPLIGRRTAELAAAAEVEGTAVLVHDVPLLVENDLAGRYDLVVVVDAPPELQLRRLVEQRGMTDSDARARMARQATREQRLAAADEVVCNDGTLEQLRTRVDALWSRLRARVGR